MKPKTKDDQAKDSERDPAEAARIRDEALKRAMGMGPPPTKPAKIKKYK